MSLHLLAQMPYRPVVHLVEQQIRNRKKNLHLLVAHLVGLAILNKIHMYQYNHGYTAFRCVHDYTKIKNMEGYLK